MNVMKEVKLLSDLGSNIRRLRDEHGWSAEELSRQSGITMYTIYQIENSIQENPRLGTLQKIADGLGVTVVDLLGEPKAKAS
ncbi:MAG: helix-turn-helix transcriptional regulator [Thermoleophilia bacterium]|nr:helix-turn-helix transcriptional regulator [Thermoleophilia bacterium]